MSEQAWIRIGKQLVALPEGAIAYKYADPTEDARWVYDEDDLRDIRREDPSLVVTPDDRHGAPVQVTPAPWEDQL